MEFFFDSLESLESLESGDWQTPCFRHNVLPIAMGASPEEYERLAPTHSFIHVDQFNGPKELAEYLLELDSDDDKYNEYFQVTKTFINISYGNISDFEFLLAFTLRISPKVFFTFSRNDGLFVLQ